MCFIYTHMCTEHHGALLHKIIQQSQYKTTFIAAQLGISRPTLYKRFKKANLPPTFLLDVLDIIGYEGPKPFPGLEAYQKTYTNAFIKAQDNYIQILERYIDLLTQCTEALHLVKDKEASQRLLKFIQKNAHLMPWH